MDGYKHWFKNRNLVTVWSAPNYCYRCGNGASFMRVNEDLETSFEMFYADKNSPVVPYKSMVPYFLWALKVHDWTLNYNKYRH